MAHPKRALIVGGSLCGLMTACLLRNDGWQVAVHERVPETLSGRGAGIMTHPELLEVLALCGCESGASVGIPISERVTFHRSGAVDERIDLAQLVTSWGRLFHLLRAQLAAAEYRSGMELARIEFAADSVRAHFTNGQVAEGDLLVATDGIRSTARAQLAPEVQPEYAGYVAWRGVVDEADLSPACRRDLFGRLSFHLPPGEQMLGYPIAGAADEIAPGRQRYNFVWYRAADRDTLADLLTDVGGRRHDLSIPPPLIRPEWIARTRADAERLLSPQFAEVVRAAPQPFFQPIYDVESARLAFGRATLAGDAAFVARPHIGMGVTKAAVDALALANALRSGASVEEALLEYQTGRLRAGRAAVARARELGAYMEAGSPAASGAASVARVPTARSILRETATPEGLWGPIECA
jgi:2-polyprenyl-6-methoxyphenol hydroxylase-like FAD-dependent oxidoreductase